MKPKLTILFILILLFLPYQFAASQGMPKKADPATFMAGEPASYVSTSNIIVGPGYDGKLSMLLGYAKSLSARAYLIGIGDYGETEDNESYGMQLRGYYMFTSGKTAFNFGLLSGLGPTWERMVAGEATADEWEAHLATVIGAAATLSISEGLGVGISYEYRQIGDLSNGNSNHRGVFFISVLI